MGRTGFTILAIFGIIVALGAIFFISAVVTKDKAIEMEENIKENYHNISVIKNSANDQLVLLENAIESSNEQYLITEARTSDYTPEALANIIVTIEAYPDEPGNSALYGQWFDAIRLEANRLAQYRETYNAAVREYNSFTRKTFKSMHLNWMGYEKIEYDYISIPDEQSGGPLD